MHEEQGNRRPPEMFTAERVEREGWFGMVAPIEPAESFTLPALSHEQAAAFLRAHGCQIRRQAQEVLLVYPAGTTRQCLYPITLEERFRVCLPDGTEVREVYRRFGGNNLLLPRDAVEREIPCSPTHGEEAP